MGGVYDLVASGFCGTGALLRSASAALRVWWAGLRCPRPPGRRRRACSGPCHRKLIRVRTGPIAAQIARWDAGRCPSCCPLSVCAA